MRLREATISDAVAISDCICKSMGEHIAPTLAAPGAARLREQMTPSSIESYLGEGYVFFVAEEADRLVGVVAIRPPSHLFYLFVASPCQRRGIGRQMWYQARDWILDDCPEAEITVNSSLNAIPVYRRFGFVQEGAVQQVDDVMFQPMRWMAHFS